MLLPTKSPIAYLVIEDILERKKMGIKKYGTPLLPFNGRDALQDAYEEALDLCQYLKQAIEERNEQRKSLTRIERQSAYDDNA